MLEHRFELNSSGNAHLGDSQLSRMHRPAANPDQVPIACDPELIFLLLVGNLENKQVVKILHILGKNLTNIALPLLVVTLFNKVLVDSLSLPPSTEGSTRHLSPILPLVSQSREGLWVPLVRHTIYRMESLGRFWYYLKATQGPHCCMFN